MSELIPEILDRIKDELVKEGYLTTYGIEKFWPEVCRRYAEEVNKNPIDEQVDQYCKKFNMTVPDTWCYPGDLIKDSKGHLFICGDDPKDVADLRRRNGSYSKASVFEEISQLKKQVEELEAWSKKQNTFIDKLGQENEDLKSKLEAKEKPHHEHEFYPDDESEVFGCECGAVEINGMTYISQINHDAAIAERDEKIKELENELIMLFKPQMEYANSTIKKQSEYISKLEKECEILAESTQQLGAQLVEADEKIKENIEKICELRKQIFALEYSRLASCKASLAKAAENAKGIYTFEMVDESSITAESNIVIVE